MKKILLTCVLASFTFMASAQFMVGTALDFNNDDNNDDGFETIFDKTELSICISPIDDLQIPYCNYHLYHHTPPTDKPQH